MKSFAGLFLSLTLASTLTSVALAQDPDVIEVQRAALDYARLRHDDVSSLKKRARLSAILPRFQVGMKRSVQNDIDISIDDNVSVSSSGVTIGPETSELDQSSDNDAALEVKAVWYLNELIFSRDSLDVAEEARFFARERRAILADVNRLYFERQKKFAELGTAGKDPRRAGGASLINIRLDELRADLDAMTGGWFSGQIRNGYGAH